MSFDYWPEEIRLSADRRNLAITFDNAEQINLTAEHLRVESPSAEVQGHHPSQKKSVIGKQNVKIKKLEPTGNYAIRIIFDDGHDTGIYTWEYLHSLSK
jgi:DUF971 family protein